MSWSGSLHRGLKPTPCPQSRGPLQEFSWVKSNPVLARAMDRIFILYADREQNPSISTVRLAGSTGANPFVCISAGIAS